MQANLTYLNQQLPFGLALFFGATTALTVIFFYAAIRRANPGKALYIVAGLIAWLTILGVLANQAFFTHFNTMPPRLLLALVPVVGLATILFFTPAGQRFYDALPLSILTYLHVVRIPVEIVLYQLFVWHQVPQMMTFEGLNLDILSGLTAPIIAYLTFKKNLHKRWLLSWHIVCLGLLLNVLIIAILSAPLPFQQLNFDQPNIGIARFPFIWLPGFVAPFVGISHLVAIRQLIFTYLRTTKNQP